MKELTSLSKKFYSLYSHLILGSITCSVISSSIETVFIPKIIATMFNNIKDLRILRNNILFLILVWIIVKIVYVLSTYFRRQLEPQIMCFITTELLEKIFDKYEHENELTNVSVLISKIQIIRKSFQEMSYIVFSVFLPRIITLGISLITMYSISHVLGIIIIISTFIQAIVSSYKFEECIASSYEDNDVKDEMYGYIEDIFYNIDTIELTPNGFEIELDNIRKISTNSKEIEQNSLDCVTYKQYRSYAVNFLLTCVIFFSIYKLYEDKAIDSNQTTSTILLLTGLFDNMSEMSFFIPELTAKIGILKKNEDFLKSLTYVDDKNLDKNLEMEIFNNEIEFRNVSFKYDNHSLLNNFSVKIPEKSFICLYGPSGSGKSTFIRIIFGIEKITSGQIFVGGKDISKYHVKQIRKHMSYINQNTTHLFNTTVYKNLIYGYEDSDNLRNRIKDLFIKFGFYEIFKNLDENKEQWSFLDSNVGKLGENLSGGQKQLIHLLRLDLNPESKIVILDEPSSALDDKTREGASKFIKYLNEKGKTVLLITHDDYYKDICGQLLQFSDKENPKLI